MGDWLKFTVDCCVCCFEIFAYPIKCCCDMLSESLRWCCEEIEKIKISRKNNPQANQITE